MSKKIDDLIDEINLENYDRGFDWDGYWKEHPIEAALRLEVDTMKAVVQAAKDLAGYRRCNSALSFQLEKADDFFIRLEYALCAYEEVQNERKIRATD